MAEIKKEESIDKKELTGDTTKKTEEEVVED